MKRKKVGLMRSAPRRPIGSDRAGEVQRLLRPKNYGLLAVSVGVGVGIYFTPALVDAYRLFFGFASLFVLPCLLPFALLVASFLIPFLISAIKRAVKERDLLPLLLPLLAVVAVVLWPPPMYEEALFTLFRPRYENMVELTVNNQLSLSDSPSISCGKGDFEPPQGLAWLAGECIYSGRVDSPGISGGAFHVTFSPRTSYRPIVYIEDPRDIGWHYACESFDGQILKRLDTNWFICHDDWN